MERRFPLFKQFLALAALQALFVLFIPPLTEPDSAGYIESARQWLEAGAFYMPQRPPGYPAFLAAVYALGGGNFAVIALQHALGLLAWLLTASLLPAGRQRLVFTALFACDLLYSSYQHVILADFLFSLELCLSAWLLSRFYATGRARYFLLFTAMVACGIYTKPALKPFPFFIAPLFLLEKAPAAVKARRALLALALPLALASLWSLRNYRVSGHFAMVPFESYHYVGRVINHLEFPEGSLTRDIFLRERGQAPLPRDRKAAAFYSGLSAAKAAGFSDETVDSELRRVFRLSVLRHPLVYLKESLAELFYFFFSAHNLYAKHLLAGRMPESATQALRTGNFGTLLLKFASSMYFYYWLLLALLLLHARASLPAAWACRDMTQLYLYAVIAYIALVSSFANEGLARFRGAVHPFMIYFAARQADEFLARLRGGRK